MRVESLVFAAAALLTACDADRVQRPHHDAAPGFNRAPAPYVVTDLGLAGSAYAINDGQEIVGDIASSGGTRAFRRLWNGQVDKLANLGKNGSSHANDISARGAIAGWSTHGPGLFPQAVLWTSPFTIQSLGTLGGRWSQSTGVNSFRNVVGTSETASGTYEAFFREAASGTMRSIGLFGGSWSEAAEINEDNVVAGTADDGQGGILGFLWHPYGGILGKWPLAYIKAVNNRQTAAGYTWSFVFQAAFATTFPLSRPPVVSGGPSSTHQDINDQDLAVGACQSGWWYACASAAGAAPTLLPPLNTSGSINDIAEGVNNYGTIVGTSAGKAVMWHP